MLISQVWKLARRSNVCSALKIFRKMSCVRSSASSCRPTNLYARLKTLRQCWRTISLPRDLIAGETSLDQRVGGGGWDRRAVMDMRTDRTESRS